jgi:hypothetical protein
MLKEPGIKRFKLNHDKLLSSFAFNFNLRRYVMGCGFPQFLALTALNDTSKGYIVNDTLVIKCDINLYSDVGPIPTTAAPAAPRETHA